MFSGVMNHASLFSLAVCWTNLGLAYARRALKFGGGGITVWSCFSGFHLGHSVLQHTKTFFENNMLTTLGQQFGEVSFLS